MEHVCALERYRPFAIGTRHMDALERVVRVVEYLAQVAHLCEIQRSRLGGSLVAEDVLFEELRYILGVARYQAKAGADVSLHIINFNQK